MTDRFSVTYRIATTDAAEARARAEGIALEQTVEIPRDVVPSGFVEDVILGRVEAVEAVPGGFEARIGYSPECCGDALPSLLNVMFGNSSMQAGIKVTSFDPGPLAAVHPGANFGATGIRRMTGATGPMIVPVLKPQGSGTDELARIAALCARGGAHIVKEDHGLAGQRAAPFRERVPRIAVAVARANAATGGRTLYFATLCGPAHALPEMAEFAVGAGADGVLVMPGLFGFGVIRDLARRDRPVPIMAHPSLLGSHVLARDSGFTHAMTFGTLQRLAGADISVFPNVGGRFGFTAEECLSIARACRAPDGIGRAILPSPGGGMTLARADEMRAMYGDDVAFLLGGSLLREGDAIGDAVARLRARLEG